MLVTNLGIVKIDSSKYGRVIAYYDKKIDKLGNGFIIRCIKKNKLLSGYIDLNKKLIIDLEEMAYNSYFVSNLGNDICLAFMMPNGLDKYFHIKSTGESYRLVMQTDNESPLIVTKIKNDKRHWLLTSVEEEPKMALYDYNTGKVVTCYLDDIELIEDSDRHKYYYEKNLLGTCDEEKIYATTLCGFLDEDARFSSDIFDTESDNLVYDANVYVDTLTKNFEKLCNTLILHYVQKQADRKEEIDDIIYNMYINPIEIKEKKGAKILKFKRKKV